MKRITELVLVFGLAMSGPWAHNVRGGSYGNYNDWGGMDNDEVCVEALKNKLRQIVVPEVRIEGEELGDVIAMIRHYGKNYDSSGVGFNVMFSGTPAQARRRVTILATNLPLADLVRYLCLDNGLTYRIDRAALIITARGEKHDVLEARVYPVSAGVHFTIEDERAGRGAKVFLEEKGVSFPPGSQATFLRRVGRLVAYNTQENLRHTERILLELGIWQPDAWRPAE